jgi:hypothetical protein
MVAERYDGGCDNGTDRPASPATRFGMNETTHPNDDLHVASAGAATDGAAHVDGAHVDTAHGDHAQSATLGPIDWAAWGAGLLGIMAGLAVAACLYLSTTL